MYADPGGGGPPRNFKTSFDDLSLEDMNAMVQGANWNELATNGQALLEAQTKILGVAGDLKSHLNGVVWQGEGADAFREWGNQLANQSYGLADYTGLVGDQLVSAGSSLQYVQSAMPKSTRTECFTDAKKEAAAVKAEEPDRQEAVRMMESLASSYTWAKGQISTGAPPNFEPVPISVGNEEGYVRPYRSTAPVSSGGISSLVSDGRADGLKGPSRSSSMGKRERQPTQESTQADPRTSLDSTASQAEADPTNRRVSGSPYLPRSAPTGSSTFLPQYVPLPGSQGLPRRPMDTGDQSLQGGPRRNAIGAEGIIGGASRPLPSSGVRALGRNVIGRSEEEHPLVGASGSGRATITPRVVGARQSAIAPGAGNRRLARPNSLVEEETADSAAGTREFTPGGSGLVGRPQSSGSMQVSAIRGGNTRNSARSRPDYLEEDEETWDVARSDIVPPVLG